jgi:hypothetical protein
MQQRGLLCKILRMQDLFTIYRGNIRFKDTLDSPETAIISYESSTQLRYIISKEILQLEIAILSEIDSLVYTSSNISRQDPLAFWICLWTLIFCYKSHVIYCKTGIDNPSKHFLQFWCILSQLTFILQLLLQMWEKRWKYTSSLDTFITPLHQSTQPFTERRLH